MDERVRNRLIEQALAIEKFRNLHAEEQDWLFPMLNRSIQTTIDILDAIANERKTFEEIAGDLGIHPQTVSQKLNALANGGMALDLSQTAAYAPTGRPRKLARR